MHRWMIFSRKGLEIESAKSLYLKKQKVQVERKQKVQIGGKSKKFTCNDKLDLSCRSTEIVCGRLHGKLKSNRLRQKMKKKTTEGVCKPSVVFAE